MSNIYLDIVRRANSTPYLYGDLIAPLSAIPLADMRLSLADDYAFVDFGIPNVLTDNIGKKVIIISKTTGKKAIGYIKAAGTGETYGEELITGWANISYETFLSSEHDITSAINSGGGVEMAQTNNHNVTMGRLYVLIATLILNSGAIPRLYRYNGNGSQFGTFFAMSVGVNTIIWVEPIGGENATTLMYNAAESANWSCTFTKKQVLTPSATGVTIVSTPGGSTYNWESIESGFDYNDANGYTCEIDDLPCGNGHVYKCTTPGDSGSSPPTFNTGAGSTTEDGEVIWTEYNPSGIYYLAALQFTRSPKYGDYRRKRKYLQPIDYSDGADLYSYDKGLSARNTREITFQSMLTADLTRLLEFIEIIRGVKYAFNFYDENGAEHKSLLINPDDITSAPVAPGMEGEITLELLFV